MINHHIIRSVASSNKKIQEPMDNTLHKCWNMYVLKDLCNKNSEEIS